METESHHASESSAAGDEGRKGTSAGIAVTKEGTGAQVRVNTQEAATGRAVVGGRGA